MSNVINWFEIPVSDFDRASKFYSEVLDGSVQLFPEAEGMPKMGFLPGYQGEEGSVGGAIVLGEGYNPSSNGSLVYLNGGNDLSVPLSKVEAAGGRILVPKTGIGENGYFAHFEDSEGNRVALHSMS